MNWGQKPTILCPCDGLEIPLKMYPILCFTLLWEGGECYHAYKIHITKQKSSKRKLVLFCVFMFFSIELFSTCKLDISSPEHAAEQST